MNPRKLTLIAIVPALLALAAAGCGGTSDSGGSGGKVALVAYSTPKEAYAEVIPAFKKSPAGKDVGFSQSYGASGDQTRSVESGLPADVVALSLALDTDKLVKKGLVAEDWDKGKFQPAPGDEGEQVPVHMRSTGKVYFMHSYCE